MRCELIDSMGTDLTVVNAARVSMDKESSYESEATCPTDSNGGKIGPYNRLRKGDKKLLSYLARESHWTPYSHARETFTFLKSLMNVNLTEDYANSMVIEGTSSDLIKVRHSIWGWAALIRRHALSGDASEHVSKILNTLYPESWKAMGMGAPDAVNRDAMVRHEPTKGEKDPRFIDITMRETVPIFVARQRFKHMVGFTYNEVSRRYVDDTPEFYEPKVWRSRPEGSIKQGSGESAVFHCDDGYHGETGEPINYVYDDIISHCQFVYASMLKAGVAPEQARMVLPQSMYTSYYVTGSLAAWARAYKQRIDAHAQVEIQDLAKQWGDIIAPLFPESWAVLTGGSDA